MYLCHAHCLGTLSWEQEGGVRLQICELGLCGHLQDTQAKLIRLTLLNYQHELERNGSCVLTISITRGQHACSVAVCWACILVHNPLGAESTGLLEKTLHGTLVIMSCTPSLTFRDIQIRLQHLPTGRRCTSHLSKAG